MGRYREIKGRCGGYPRLARSGGDMGRYRKIKGRCGGYPRLARSGGGMGRYREIKGRYREIEGRRYGEIKGRCGGVSSPCSIRRSSFSHSLISPISPPYLPYISRVPCSIRRSSFSHSLISPVSPPYLPYISRVPCSIRRSSFSHSLISTKRWKKVPAYLATWGGAAEIWRRYTLAGEI